jgi:hypothetical protein
MDVTAMLILAILSPQPNDRQLDRELFVAVVRWVKTTEWVGSRSVAIAVDHMGHRVVTRRPPNLSAQDASYIAARSGTRAFMMDEVLTCAGDHIRHCRLNSVDVVVTAQAIRVEGNMAIVQVAWLYSMPKFPYPNWATASLKLQRVNGQWSLVEVISRGEG